MDDARTLGSRIAEARNRAGLTQADVAAAVALDRSAYAKIETGARRVTALELARIAQATGERVEWLMSRAPDSIVSHRNMHDPGAASPAIDRVVERVARNVEFVLRHERFGADPAGGFARPTNMAEAEAAAATARSLMALDDIEPCHELLDKVASLGLISLSTDLGADSADAASILLEDHGVAVVNGRLRVGRRRLALAHEVGHFLFADEYVVDWKVAEHDDSETWETRLDRFARAVLLPPHGVVLRWAEYLEAAGGDLRVAAIRLASTYRVDMSTAARRLVELDRISPAEASRVRAVRTTKADIIEHGLVIRDELAPPALTREYERAVLRLYRAETISAARAVDLLLDTWDESDLPELPRLPDDAIWQFVS